MTIVFNVFYVFLIHKINTHHSTGLLLLFEIVPIIYISVLI